MNTPRINLRLPFVIMALMSFLLLLGGPLVIAGIALVYAPFEVSIWIALGAVVFVAALGYAMSSSYQWIELRDGTIRGKRLLTRGTFEQPVEEIVRVMPLSSPLMGPLANAALNAAMKTSNRGYELRFRSGKKIALIRGDMAGLDDFVAVLGERLGSRWEEVTAG